MLFAQKKRDENIAEYILYMYQIEDVIRAYQFNVERLVNEFALPQLPDKTYEAKYIAWYESLIFDMESERIIDSGHRMELQEIVMELSYLHNSLLTVMNDEKYQTLFQSATEFIDNFKEKSNLKDKNHIEICFHALYMKMLLKIQKKDISAESEEGFDAMRILIAYLTRSFHQMKNSEGKYWAN